MEEILFGWSKLKIKRANEHIVNLNNVLNAFVKTNFYRFGIEKDPKTSEHFVVFELTDMIPAVVPLIMGDALHNLRTALDYLAHDTVRLCGGFPTNFTKFPFRETRQEVKSALDGGVMQGIGIDLITCIMEEIQPYKGGNDPLYTLHALDGNDKHSIPPPVFSVAKLLHVNMEVGTNKFTDCTFGVEQGGKMRVARIPPDAKIKGHGQPTFAVLFDGIEGFEGQAVVPTLLQLSQLVSGTIQIIERAYLARRRYVFR